jgi:hypothetical protein
MIRVTHQRVAARSLFGGAVGRQHRTVQASSPVSMRKMRLVATAFEFALAGLALAACGGSTAPGVASLGSTTTVVHVSHAGGTSQGSGLVEFAHCMRTHGVPNFPEPQATANGYSISIGPGSGVDPTSKPYQSARSDCGKFLPKGPNGKGGQRITESDQTDYLRAVACVRTHGFPGFPDPTFTSNNVQFHIPPTINQKSSQFQNAVLTCQKLIPRGLPYSGTS